MYKKVCCLLFGLLLGAIHNSSAQQISVDNTVGVQQLIENNLVQGCVETSNISSPINGSINGLSSYGYFERGNSNFPFENGIVITTGDANSSGNTTNANVLNEGETNWGTDADLENALGITNTLNATTIEFDFISISNQIQFNYILASEEYFGNFPCDYSDGFAFLIRPAASAGAYTNIAVIPGTTIPVNTSTIHDEVVGFCAAENEQYFDGYNIGDTNYNGRTQVLTATATIVPNVEYSIKLIIADQTDENYDSAVFIEGNSFNATVDLGGDITTCAENVVLNGDIQNPQATYQWYRNGALLNGETAPSINADQSGNYRLVVSIPLNGTTCDIEDSVIVTLSSEQASGNISDYEVCDDQSADGIEWFDLSTKTNEVIGVMPPSSYQISYHYSQADAQNNVNSINAPIQNTSNPTQIFVRIEDVTSGCLAYANFNLIVNQVPNIQDPSPLEVCDDSDNDGFTEIFLSQADAEITNNNPNLQVSYHHTLADANTGANAILLPYINSAQTENLFVRVIDVTTGCVNTTSITVTVNPLPEVNSVAYVLDACEEDEYAAFDLTSAELDITAGLTNVTVSYHVTYDDAETGANPIADPSQFNNTNPNVQTIYVRVEDNTTGCPAIVTITLHVSILRTATSIRDYEACDDESADGIEAFDLSAMQDEILNGLEDADVTFYLTETDLLNLTNPIDETQPFYNTTNPQTLYIELTYDDCADQAEIVLNVNPPLLLPDVVATDLCDTDDDGFTSIDLSNYDDLVSNGIFNYTVSYHATEADAENGANSHPNFYTNVSNPEIFYARVTDLSTGCHDVAEMQLNIIPAPTVSQPSDIIICDDDFDAMYIVDLDSKIPEIVMDTTDLNIGFFTSLSNAESNTNPILDSSNFNTATQTVYTRVESTVTSCYTIVPIEIIVNTVPVVSAISNYQICELEDDQQAEFLFNTKDNEILNGQSAMTVSYYESQSDALNRINAINKNASYINNSSPQTIFVRIENDTDADCFATGEFTIVVDPLPVFNPPLDWFICDDASNDGVHTFDLNEKITEINEGVSESLNITFYTSLNNANAGANAIDDLEYTNIENPQQIYARVENGSSCYTIAEFGLNVIQAPETNNSLPLEVCDEDYDGISTFDLTISEFDVLNIRQDNIVVTYYENEDDLEAQVNTIANPEAYNNTSNPQTVFIRVTNTISNCYVNIPLDLIVNLPPPLNEVDEVIFCETDDSRILFEDITIQLMDDTTGIRVSYFENQTDAITDQNALTTEGYVYANPVTTLFVRAEYIETGCFITKPFDLVINPNPIANTPQNLELCDDDDDEIMDFDLSLQTNTILNGQNPSMFTVTYHENQESADLGDNAIDTNYLAFDEQIIYVRIENNATGCYDTTQFMTIVHPLPIIDIDDVVVICLDALPLTLSADTGNANDIYTWSTGASTPEIEIDNVGTYSVTVTSQFGCQTSKDFEVIQSEPASFEVVEIVDFSDPNNVTITVSGIGNYAYILDDGEPQTSNVFEYVSLGYHTVTVIDLNGCTEVIKEIVVVDVPKFFTPNNDGYFDTWHITGVETLPGTTVTIFDRYGKQLHYLTHTSLGWNGLYNGKEMPSSDYWFVANVRKDNISFEIKGHFTLKR
ncbi:MAG: T9SS type B sorting domain-containing protein [Flavobacteriaceae bacterium]|nr:T9SS type B sorting domain-containing protein [Flavobacteriaceae bacterium]